MTYRRLLCLVYQIFEGVVLVGLKGSEDEIQDQFSVFPRSLLHLLGLLKFSVVRHRLDDTRGIVQLPCLELGLTSLLDLVSETEIINTDKIV